MIGKLGLVLECAREGADEKVLKCLTRRLAPQTQLAPPQCMVSKEMLIKSGAEAAKLLLEADRCDRVFVVWDLKPEWEEQKQLLDCKEECDLIAAKLDDLGIRENVDLICIVEMLETWIIADDRALSTHLSRPPRNYAFKRIKAPESVADPKGLLISTFKQTFRKTYRDHTDAVRVIQKCQDSTRLERVSSFARFVTKLTGKQGTAFSRCGEVCNDLAPSGVFQPAQAVILPAPIAKPVFKQKARPRR